MDMSRQQKFFRTIIDQVEPGTKAAKLRDVMPEIERKIAAGARIADIVEALNDNGLDLTLATLKSYLYRFRRTARQSGTPDRTEVGSPATDIALTRFVAEADATTDAASTTTGLLRHINTARCMRMLRRGVPLTRADLARELSLTRATIGRAIGELLEAGLVTETLDRTDGSRAGRPGTIIRLNPDGAYSIGIDISSASLTGVLLDLDMRVLRRIAVPLGPNAADVPAVIERMAHFPAQLLAAAGIAAERVQGLCVSVPGLVDRRGHVVVAPFLGWHDVPLRSLLRARSELPWTIQVCNDAVAFARAECAVADAKDTQNMLLVLLTEGLGGAIVQQGQVFQGAHGYAGELGHMVMHAGLGASPPDSFEMLAGYRRFLPFLPQDLCFDDGLAWLAASESQAGNPELAPVFDAWAEALAAGLLNLIHILDPERIVLGGPLSLLFPQVEERVKQLLQSHLLHGFELPRINVTRFGADGAAIGAAAVIREQMFSLPQLDSR